jgi:predicted dehydrogenase
VTIAAPTHLHRDLALACIDRGVHILVEKPIASSVDEGQAIIAAARRSRVRRSSTPCVSRTSPRCRPSTSR